MDLAIEVGIGVMTGATPIVKICGVTRPDDAAAAVRAGADWLGLNFWPRSKRYITADQAGLLAAAARRAADQRGRAVTLVGLFVNQPGDHIAGLVARIGIDRVQVHGDETPAACAALTARGLSVIKAVALASPADVDRLAGYPLDTFVIDAPTAGYGGSGQTFDWNLARRAVATGRRILLAGGLTPDNVAAAVAEVHPYGVDVASGVESAPGVKDPARMRAFVARARI